MAGMARQGQQQGGGFLDALTRLGELIRFRYLGIGFVWAWIYCAFSTGALFPQTEGGSINIDPSWLVSALVVTATLFVSGMLLRKRDIAKMRWLHLAAPIALSAGTLFSGLCALFGATQVVLYIIGGVVTGAGSGLMILLWVDLLSRLDTERVEVIAPASSLIMLLCSLVFPFLTGVLGMIGVTTLPLISGVLLALSYRGPEVVGSSPTSAPAAFPHERRGDKFPLARLSVLLCCLYLIVGCTESLGPIAGKYSYLAGFDAPTFIGSLFGILLALCFIRFSLRIDFTSLMRWLAPLMIIGLVLFSLNGSVSKILAFSIWSVTDTSLQVITVIYFITQARSHRMSPVFAMGVAQGSIQLGVLLGNLLGQYSKSLSAAGVFDETTLVLALICVVALTPLLVPARREQALPPLPEGADDHDAVRMARCDQLAQQHGLSAREREIMGYLVKGRSQPYIREELVLSKNTVATHVKHLYFKLGVHGRQELLDLVEK